MVKIVYAADTRRCPACDEVAAQEWHPHLQGDIEIGGFWKCGACEHEYEEEQEGDYDEEKDNEL